MLGRQRTAQRIALVKLEFGLDIVRVDIAEAELAVVTELYFRVSGQHLRHVRPLLAVGRRRPRCQQRRHQHIVGVVHAHAVKTRLVQSERGKDV